MRSQFVLAALVTILCLQSVAQRQNANDGVRTKDQQNTARQKNPSSPNTLSQPSTNAANQVPAGVTDQHQDQQVRIVSIPEIPIKPAKDWMDRSIVICTIGLTIVGVVGTFVALRSLRQIRRQAELMDEHRIHLESLATAANNNARAAIDSVKALRESERAWIVEEIRFPDHIPRRSEGNFGGVLMVGFVAKNVGKQPAFIRVVQSRFFATQDRFIRMRGYVLFSEFVLELSGAKTSLPSALATVPRADESFRATIFSICERMRNSDDMRDSYIRIAQAAENALRLRELMAGATVLGVRDTFPFQDRLCLLELQKRAQEGRLDQAVDICRRLTSRPQSSQRPSAPFGSPDGFRPDVD